MDLRLTATFREDAVNHNPLAPPSETNPGGGVAQKARQLQLALPRLEFLPYLSQAGDIHMMEQLWFTRGNLSEELMMKRIEEYTECPAFKLLWTSDLECLRWRGVEREAIFDATDVICGNSKYMVNILRTYAPAHKVALLTDCIDTNSITPLVKKKQIFGMSNVIIEKNIDAIVSIYQELKQNEVQLQLGYIGSSKVWGIPIRDSESRRLEMELANICDWVIEQANRPQVSQLCGESWGFVVDSRFDSFCYALMEALLGGCWAFCGNHKIYDDLPVIRFSTTDEAVLKIMDKCNGDLSHINAEGRQFVHDNFSLDVFRRQFLQIVGGNFV